MCLTASTGTAQTESRKRAMSVTAGQVRVLASHATRSCHIAVSYTSQHVFCFCVELQQQQRNDILRPLSPVCGCCSNELGKAHILQRRPGETWFAFGRRGAHRTGNTYNSTWRLGGYESGCPFVIVTRFHYPYSTGGMSRSASVDTCDVVIRLSRLICACFDCLRGRRN